MMIEYTDPAERAVALGRASRHRGPLLRRECGWLRASLAIADEDLERENAEKTSAVHWLRFELPASARDAIKARRARSRSAPTIRTTAT